MNILTLDEFITAQLKQFPQATGQLSTVLKEIALAAKRINHQVNRAGLCDLLGETGESNHHDEMIQRLDLFAHHALREVLKNGRGCAGIASEEMEDMEVFEDDLNKNSKYVVAFDPLDGSSNIDCNISIGTIFGIYKRLTVEGTKCALRDFLQPGSALVAAGYIIYGPSTMLVYATKRGINGFTLDPTIGEFCLSHPDIQCPVNAKAFSINMGYQQNYSEEVKGFIAACQAKGFSQRYAGSLVADVHRTLLKGGIFLYPYTFSHPAGKLRLLYECNPMAYLLEAAGGMALDGFERMLVVAPSSLHQRSAAVMGSKGLVEHYFQPSFSH